MPCPHVRGDDRCEIHADLRHAGFPGCTVFDCLGAGQQVTQVTFGGASWRDGPVTAAAIFAAFETMRALHELRWHLAEARTRVVSPALADAIADVATRVTRLAAADAEKLHDVDADALRCRPRSPLPRSPLPRGPGPPRS